MKSIYGYALIVWVLFLIIGVMNGIVRNEFYSDSFSELTKHQISSVIFILVLLVIMFLFFNNFGAVYTKKDLWLIGLMWLALTMIFEFGFGHYIFGNSWEILFADYNLMKGRLLGLVLFFTFFGPRLVARD